MTETTQQDETPQTSEPAPYVVDFLMGIGAMPGCKHPVESYYPEGDEHQMAEPSWKVAENAGWAQCTGGYKWRLTPAGVELLKSIRPDTDIEPVDEIIGLEEAAWDLLQLQRKDPVIVGHRYDRWNCLAEILENSSTAILAGEWKPVEQTAMLKGLRRSPKYYPAAGETCRMSGPNCDDENGYTWSEVEVLWRDDVFVVTRLPGCWPTVAKLEHVLFEPSAHVDGKV